MHLALVRGVFVFASLPMMLRQPVAVRRLTHRPSDGPRGAVYTPLDAAGVAVISDTAQWARVWHTAMPDTPLPPIDFTRETVIAISYGSQTGCHAATRHVVRAVAGRADTVWVEARRDPKPTGRCDGMFSMADLAVVNRAHAHVQWRAVGTRGARDPRPHVPTAALWPDTAPPST